ncbi:hypothetical protein FJT64_025168 [Amphibalanus amphitrite]|uniref:Uncharacterized protein n=1 Tax=Amphibalanus amphitrite TaxID=1232801 RepID=A0A6A4WJB5_AMPAM|nr:hypothetical protein FJT64_025168 [Amphibalanus amphitrite]
MVPDALHLSAAMPLGPPADHAKTLEAVWRPGPGVGLWDAPAGQTSLCGTGRTEVPSCAAACRPDLAACRPDLTACRPDPASAWSRRCAEPRRPSDGAGYPARAALYPVAGCTELAGGCPYPGRSVAAPAQVQAPLRSSRVSSSSDVVKDFSQPLFVDTTVEYDLPKAAYPPENSEPLLMVRDVIAKRKRRYEPVQVPAHPALPEVVGKRPRLAVASQWPSGY